MVRGGIGKGGKVGIVMSAGLDCKVVVLDGHGHVCSTSARQVAHQPDQFVQ